MNANKRRTGGDWTRTRRGATLWVVETVIIMLVAAFMAAMFTQSIFSIGRHVGLTDLPARALTDPAGWIVITVVAAMIYTYTTRKQR